MWLVLTGENPSTTKIECIFGPSGKNRLAFSYDKSFSCLQIWVRIIINKYPQKLKHSAETTEFHWFFRIFFLHHKLWFIKNSVIWKPGPCYFCFRKYSLIKIREKQEIRVLVCSSFLFQKCGLKKSSFSIAVEALQLSLNHLEFLMILSALL